MTLIHNNMTKTAVVIGASGLTGGFLVKRLVENPIYDKIIIVARKPIAEN